MKKRSEKAAFCVRGKRRDAHLTREYISIKMRRYLRKYRGA